MSSQALEHIIEEVKTLTPEERRQLLAHLERDRRTADLRRIQAKYAGMKTTSDAFASRKAEEIELEDRPRR
jgi:nitrate reductase assembly molybdenum cofactor insertion protein NarJ